VRLLRRRRSLERREARVCGPHEAMRRGVCDGSWNGEEGGQRSKGDARGREEK
jgi:hypothetical protein